MDVDETLAYGSVVTELAPVHGSFSGLQGDGLSSLQTSEQPLASSELENGKAAKVRALPGWLCVAYRFLDCLDMMTPFFAAGRRASPTPSARHAKDGQRRNTSALWRQCGCTVVPGAKSRVSGDTGLQQC